MIDNKFELYKYINNNIKPKQKEKQEYGEVFTPLNIIEQLFENLDKKYKEINNNSIFEEVNFKWGDVNGSGIGNFSIVIYFKLMDGLKNIIINENERKKHILENMIYMAEYNINNIEICKKIFESNEYKLNLFHGDALTLNINKEWGIDKFDVIVGNPPFNKGGIKSCSGKYLNKNGEKNITVWPRFVKKSFENLKEEGFLILIHPLSWLKKCHSIHNVLLEKYIIYLKLWDNAQSKICINGEIPLSVYILQNINNLTELKTKVITELKRYSCYNTSLVYLDKNISIPLGCFNIYNKLSKFIDKYKCKLDINTKTVRSNGIQQQLPDNYDIKDKWGIDTYRLRDGIIVKKLIEKHPDIDKRKIIIANKTDIIGHFIDEGKIGLTGNHKYYILGDNLELIKKILSFKFCRIITIFLKYRQQFLEIEVFNYIPDLRKMDIIDIEEDEFYKLVGFDENEIKYIYQI